MELTVKEAIEQGYEYYIYDGLGFQALNDLSDGDINFDNDPVLCSKEPQSPSSPTKSEFKEWLYEYISGGWESEQHDEIHLAICKIDFTDIINKINHELSTVSYYPATDIELIEDK